MVRTSIVLCYPRRRRFSAPLRSGEIMIRKILKVIGWITAAAASVAVIAVIGVWALGSAKINQKFSAPTVGLSHSSDPAVIAEGERLATITGCNGCHAPRMQGQVFGELPDGTRLIAPNIPRLAATYTDEDLARSIRYGVKSNGKGVLGMPSDAFFGMTDDDLVAILSYIRATPDEGGESPNTRIGLMARAFLISGEVNTAPIEIGDFDRRPVFDFNDDIEKGAYLARIACAECHGLDLKGTSFDDFGAPDLVVASAYTSEQFNTLMRTGVGASNRDLGLMSKMGLYRFSSFTDEEVSILHEFLKHRAMNAN